MPYIYDGDEEAIENRMSRRRSTVLETARIFVDAMAREYLVLPGPPMRKEASKGQLFAELDWDKESAYDNTLFEFMMWHTRLAYVLMIHDPSSFRDKTAYLNGTLERPYRWEDFTDEAIGAACESLFADSNEHTSEWFGVRSQDGAGQEVMWVGRWMLWHQFRGCYTADADAWAMILWLELYYKLLDSLEQLIAEEQMAEDELLEMRREQAAVAEAR